MQRRSIVRAALACAAVLTSLSIGFPLRSARAAADAPKPGSDGWYEATPPDGSFHVRGPVAFQSFVQSEGSNPPSKVRTEGVRANQPGAFDAVTRYIASCVVDPDDHRKDLVRIEETLMRWQHQADFTYRRPVTAGKVSGVEFELSDPSKTMRVRVFPGPDRICTVLIQWNQYAKPNDADIDRFLGSFAFAKR